MGASILIVGAGGVGLLYSHYLEQSDKTGVEIAFVARSNAEQLSSSGADIVKVLAEATDKYKPATVFDGKIKSDYSGKPFDYVIITAKSVGGSVIKGLDRYIGPETLIVLAQNGIEIEDPYLREYPQAGLASAVVRVATELTGPAEVTHYSPAISFTAGLVSPKAGEKDVDKFQGKLAALRDISLQSNIIKFDLTEHIITDRWEKILWNGSFNTIAAITDLNVEGLFAGGLENLLAQSIQEIWSVGLKVLGEENWIPLSKALELIPGTKKLGTKGFVPSTLQDVRKGKEIEVEALSGNLIKAADREGVPVPTLKIINNLLSAINYRLSEGNLNKL